MNKLISIRWVLVIVTLIVTARFTFGQTVNDGCGDVEMRLTWTFIEDSDGEIEEEHRFKFWGRDNANVDGLSWQGGNCIQWNFSGFGWNNITDLTLFNSNYGSPGPVGFNRPQYVALRGEYWEDDNSNGDFLGCGSSCSYDGGCFFDPDDHHRGPEEIHSTIPFRTLPPNQLTQFMDVITGGVSILGGNAIPGYVVTHGSHNYGGEIRVRWTSPRPSSVTASTNNICPGDPVTLTAAGAVFGGSYQWYVGNTNVGSGVNLVVNPTVTTTYKVFTENGGVESECWQEIVVIVVPCVVGCVTKNVTASPSPTTVDCSEATIAPNATFTTVDIPAGNLITDVDVSITWNKTDGSCAAPGTGSSFHNETAFELLGPAGACASTSLITTNTFSGNTSISNITTIFDEQSGNVPSGVPSSTTYNPVGDLNQCNGGNPIGNWAISAGDNACLDPLCVYGYSVTICHCEVPTAPTSASASPNPVCPSTATVQLSFSGGDGDQLAWYTGPNGTGAFLGTGNGLSVPTPASNTTYYCRWESSDAVCGGSSDASVTVMLDTESTPVTVVTTSSDTLCPGESASISASGGSSGTGATVQWYTGANGTGASVATGLGPHIVSPTVSTTYYVRREGDCNTTSDGSVSIAVLTNSYPPTSSSASDLNPCPGDTISLTASGGAPGYNGQLVWYSGSCGGTLVTDPANVIVPNITTTYYARYESECDTTVCASITVTPKSASVAPTSAIATNTGPCPTDTFSLLTIGGSAGTGATLVWYAGSCGGTIVSNPAMVPAPATATIYYARYEGECNTTSCAQVLVTPKTLSSAYTGAITNNNNFCGSDTATLTASGGSNGSGASTVWYTGPNGTGINLGTGNPIQVTPTTTTTYYVRREGDCNTTSDQMITLNVLPLPNITNVTSSNALCANDSSGTIVITASGGTGSLSYSIDGGTSYQSSNSFLSVPVGNFNVFVRDSSGCVREYSNNPIVITGPPSLFITASGIDASCQGVFDGELSAIGFGGTPPFQYTVNGGPLQPSGTFTGLAAGSYVVSVVDANGCEEDTTIIINNSYTVSASIDTTIDVSCFGLSDGSFTIAPSGGIGPYSFSIDNINFQLNPTFSTLSAGSYSVVTQDSKGCTIITGVSINEPTALVINIDSILNAGCFGDSSGSIYTTTSGGSMPYSYSWSTSDTTKNLNDVPAGTYSITATDDHNCTASASATIIEPQNLFVQIASFQNVLCKGDSTGFVDISVSGGTPPFTFAWSNGSNSEDVLNVPVGSYTVTVTDAQGCNASVSQTITEPLVLASSAISTDVTCNGDADGSIDLSVSGGTLPYTFLWSNGATSEDLSAISGGSYTVVITDANGCVTSLTESIFEPNAISITLIPTDVLCNGAANGSITAIVNGGNGGNSYLWSNGDSTLSISGLSGGTYTLTVTDTSGCMSIDSVEVDEPILSISGTLNITDISCNGLQDGMIDLTINGGTLPYIITWSNGATTEDISNLSMGTYSVTVVDANGCSFSDTGSISEPPALTTSIIGTNVTCAGSGDGAADLTVSGGTPPYAYLWSTFQTSQDISGLSQGTYTVIVTDDNGCVVTDSIVISEPLPIVISFTASDISCNGGADGSITTTVSNGTPGYSFAWNTGDTIQNLSGLAAGTYDLTITDQNGCTATSSVTLTEPSALTLSGIVTDVDCNGNMNGSVDLTVVGGSPSYSYAWSSGETTEDILGKSGGTYTVIVADANNCSDTMSFTILEPTALTTSIVGTDVTCSGSGDGAADLTVSGGTPPYAYLWSTFQTAQDISGLSQGTYTVIVTDDNGCVVTDSVVIDEPMPIMISFAASDISCYGGTDGSINTTVSNGTPGYSFAWNTGDTIQNLSGLTAGTYDLTVTDQNGCTASSSVTLSEPNALNLTAVITDVDCNGNMNGAIDLTVTGGTASYSYAWSSGETTANISGKSGGVYSVIVTDANSCADTMSYTIVEPAVLTSNVSITNVTCNNFTDGAVDLTVNGGTAPYSFLWSNFQTTEDISGLTAGLYIVVITDANGCVITDSALVTEPTAISVNFFISNVNCFGGNDGTVGVLAFGGTPPYDYNWSNGDTTSFITGLSQGSYVLTITDANGCTTVDLAQVLEPEDILITGTVINVGCNGDSTGSIDISVSGGTSPYTYNWSNGMTTQDISAQPLGTYVVTVTDANLCTDIDTFTIAEPAILASSIAGTNVSCNGLFDGSADLSVSGGSPPYTYFWSNFSTSQDLSGLSAGTYYVVITDDNGCSIIDQVTITEPLLLTVSVSVNDASCYGSVNGVASASVSGGTPGYSYLWNTNDTTQAISGLTAGMFTVTVTDDNNCVATGNGMVSEPDSLNLSAVITNVSCNNGGDGAIDLQILGGVMPYSYAWSNSATTEDVNGLTAGTYSVVVTDANGCSDSASYSITEPNPITLVITSSNVTCNGGANGSASVAASGGTAPYSYLWTNVQTNATINNLSSGMYWVLVTDANGCTATDSVFITEPIALQLSLTTTQVQCFGANDGAIDLSVSGGSPGYSYSWSNAATSQDISSLAPGVYQVVVTDTNNCSDSISTTIFEPTAITLSVTTVPVSCSGFNDGSVDLIVQGGTQPYTYLWSNSGTTQDLTGLAGGTYTVTVTDANSCTSTISATVSQPNQLTLSANVTDVSCAGSFDGSIDLLVLGGTTPYTFAWSNSATTEDIFNLGGGSYSVTVTDFSGCTISGTSTVNEPAPLLVSITPTNILCNGAFTGGASASVVGGVAPYTYLWSTFDTSQSISGVAAGVYTVSVTDVNGCTSFSSVQITEPSVISVIDKVTDVVCAGDSSGQIDMTTFGGTPPYSFLWNTGDTTEDLLSLPAGAYTVVITDAAGCTQVLTFVVQEPPALVSVSSSESPACDGGNTGLAAVTISGGAPPYAYLWSTIPAQTGAIATSLMAGTYTVTVTDDNGCTLIDTVVITDPSPVTVTVNTFDPACISPANGSVVIHATGGVGPYIYRLNGLESLDSTFNDLSPGNYLVVVEDVNGCQGTITFDLIAPQGFLVDAGPAMVIARGQTIVLMPSASDSIIAWSWSPATGLSCTDCKNPEATPDETTVYTVWAMNADSCTATDTVLITVLQDKAYFFPTAFTPNNDGLNDYFDFEILGLENAEVWVFNRWGQEVYYNPNQTNGAGQGWDGTYEGDYSPLGTYVYRILVTFFDGEEETIEGTIELLR